MVAVYVSDRGDPKSRGCDAGRRRCGSLPLQVIAPAAGSLVRFVCSRRSAGTDFETQQTVNRLHKYVLLLLYTSVVLRLRSLLKTQPWRGTTRMGAEDPVLGTISPETRLPGRDTGRPPQPSGPRTPFTPGPYSGGSNNELSSLGRQFL